MVCPQHEHHLTMGEIARWWTPDPFVITTLIGATFLYMRGVAGLRARGHVVRTREIACYLSGIVTVAVSLLSPLDRLSDLLFSAHMGQHELIILVAPPLMVLGRPFHVVPFAFSDGRRDHLVGFFARHRRIWRAVTHPALVVALHGIVLWVWHIPSWFEAALASETVHAVQHLGFFVTAALFWWALIHGRYGRVGYGAAVVFVFVTAAHSSALGALFAVGGRVVYPTYVATGRAWGVPPLEDQQLAGLLMWIPAGLVFILVALGLVAAWLGEASRRTQQLERTR
jgi:putative membrane protein